MSMELWQKEDYPKIKIGVVRGACEFQQKGRIEDIIYALGVEKGKKAILSYFDRASFYAKNVHQFLYKNLNSYLKSEAKRGALITCSSGRGSYLSFVFPKKELERMIDEVIKDMAVKNNKETITVHKTSSLGPSEIMTPLNPLHVKEKSLQTSCHGCKYDDIDVDENERKAHCIPCLEPVTLRKNYTKN